MQLRHFFSEVSHRWLRVPYTLHVRENRRGERNKITVLFLHGLGDTGETWQPIIDRLPADLRIISIDLLGFGHSPKPSWARLNVKTQARSIGATLLRLRSLGPIVIVGHSMGALIAIKIARQHPRLVRGLILCSPPLYKPPRPKFRYLSRDEQLRRLYYYATKHPMRLAKLAGFAMRLRLLTPSHDIREETMDAYTSALEASIIEQDALDDMKRLSQPVRVLHGIFDPVVVGAHLREVSKANPNAKMRHIVASHEIRGQYRKKVIAAIHEILTEVTTKK